MGNWKLNSKVFKGKVGIVKALNVEDIYSMKERYYQLIPPLSFLFSLAIKNKIKATLKVQQIINIFYVGNKSEKSEAIKMSK